MSRTGDRGWIGVDLDGTLAFYDEWRGPEHIGAPVPAMLERVKHWLRKGERVKIFTARAYVGESDDPTRSERAKDVIRAWCREHVGQELEITFKKDYGMIELWDDRAVQVFPNTGTPVADLRRR